MTRKLFGMNGNLVEIMPVAKKETYEAWKRGDLMFFSKSRCFASFDLNEGRDAYMREMVIADDEKEQWDSMPFDERQERYISYIKKKYGAMTYEEFQQDDRYIHQFIPVTFPHGEVGIFFYQPNNDGKAIEV